MFYFFVSIDIFSKFYYNKPVFWGCDTMRKRKLTFKEKVIVIISLLLLSVAIIIESKEIFSEDNKYEINYEYVNIKDMAQPKVATKKDNSTIINTLFTGVNNPDIIDTNKLETLTLQEISLPALKNTAATSLTPKKIWHLPTETGYITQNPNYGHVALDIGSHRGSSEIIFPVANGTISGIYTDGAGAKIVTVLHNINGKKYTSQYVHLSAYAKGLYVGKAVTINDSLGLMGTTGYSTGVHLHLAVLDCALFDQNDSNCNNLNGFFRYANRRLSQGYIGLGAMMNVPGEWSSR